MPKYKLIYFNARGRAEVIRMIFAVAGVEYEEVRCPYPLDNEWFEVLKPTMLFKQLPALEMEGGITLYQSMAIARYLANEFGLAGKTKLERAKVDMVVDAVEDLFPGFRAIFGSNDDNERAKLQTELFEKKLPDGMSNLERVLVENAGGNGFFVGDSLTWADLMFQARLADNIDNLNPEFLKNYPKLHELVVRVTAIPSLKAWMEKRPDTVR
ncbi:hematopoietic prostaglandin D synthase-like [Glandiceps talaboti]